MNGNDLTYAYDVPEGRVYVTILPAEEREWWDFETGGRSEWEARVEVHTDPDPGSGEPHGWLTIRGRKYRIHTLRKRVSPWVTFDGRKIMWAREIPYLGGYRNDQMRPVGGSTKADDRLEEIEDDVLARFEADQPAWRRESVRLGLGALRSAQERQAERAQDELGRALNEIKAIEARFLDIDKEGVA